MTTESRVIETALQQEIERELAQYPVLVYSKGSDTVPRCGFTVETSEFFRALGCSAQFIDVLDNIPKRQALTEMTDWPTLPKIFINGVFYGDTDTLEPLRESGELATLLASLPAAVTSTPVSCPEKP